MSNSQLSPVVTEKRDLMGRQVEQRAWLQTWTEPRGLRGGLKIYRFARAEPRLLYRQKGRLITELPVTAKLQTKVESVENMEPNLALITAASVLERAPRDRRQTWGPLLEPCPM